MSPVIRFISYHLPVILYSAIVIGLSSIPNLKGPQVEILAADKIAHFIEYGIFAFLAFRSFSNLSTGDPPTRAFIISMLFMALFAVFDEYYQRFVPGRHFDVYDMISDISGAILVLLLLWVRRKRGRRATE